MDIDAAIGIQLHTRVFTDTIFLAVVGWIEGRVVKDELHHLKQISAEDILRLYGLHGQGIAEGRIQCDDLESL